MSTEFDIVGDIQAKREKFQYNAKAGFTPRMLELAGAEEVQVLNAEPDPNTFRDPYYYNAVVNVLYVKVQSGYVMAWKKVSQ